MVAAKVDDLLGRPRSEGDLAIVVNAAPRPLRSNAKSKSFELADTVWPSRGLQDTGKDTQKERMKRRRCGRDWKKERKGEGRKERKREG